MKETPATTKDLRGFGLIVGGIFAFIAAWPWIRRGDSPRTWALVLSGLLVIPGLLAPQILRQPHRLWMKLALVLGWINTRIILSVVYFVVFTPTAWILRLVGKDPMNRGLTAADTYRVVREPRDPSHLKHQF